KQRTVHGIHRLRDIFEQHDMAGQIGLPWRPDEMRQDCQVEGGAGMLAEYRGLEIVAPGPAGETPQRTFDRCLSVLTLHIARHRAMRHAEPGIVESGKKEAGVAVAEIKLVPR